MERPSGRTPSRSQPSIRSFFQPKQPNYAAPPSSTTTSTHTPPKSEEAITDSAIELQPTTKPPPAPIPPPLPTPPASTSQQQQQQRQTNLPLLPPPPSLHPQASIVPITAEHIPALRRINSLLLQVVYPDSFYTAVLTPSKSGLFSRAILWTSSPTSPPTVIGSLIIRPEEIPSASPEQQTLYIQSITLLSPYRSLGLAAAALDHVLSSAQLSSLSPDSGWDIRSVYAHVWTENEDGLRWYAARGFRQSGREPVKGYYHRLRPDTAWVVRRDLAPMAESSQKHNGIPQNETAKESVLAGAVNLPGFTTNGTTESPPEKGNAPTPPTRPNTVPSLSYQKARPQTEWNDLPEDMVVGNAGAGGPPKAMNHLSAPVSGASSRSSSAARKKKERAYPAAAFGK